MRGRAKIYKKSLRRKFFPKRFFITSFNCADNQTCIGCYHNLVFVIMVEKNLFIDIVEIYISIASFWRNSEVEKWVSSDLNCGNTNSNTNRDSNKTLSYITRNRGLHKKKALLIRSVYVTNGLLGTC